MSVIQQIQEKIVTLPPEALEELMRSIQAIEKRRKLPGYSPQDEVLVAQASVIRLSPEEEERVHYFQERAFRGTITEVELEEYGKLADKQIDLATERLVVVQRLAKKWGVSLKKAFDLCNFEEQWEPTREAEIS